MANYSVANSKDLYAASVKRDQYSSKKDNGRVLIVGGSENFHGAPALASTAAYSVLAALRVGIGYATAFVPRSILASNRAVSPDIIVRPLSGNHLNMNDISMLKKAIDNSDSLVIGSGLGRNAESLRAAATLMLHAAREGKKVVVDADAVYALAHMERLTKNFIVTPNDREFSILYGKLPDTKSITERVSASLLVARKLNANLLLKGHSTVVTDGKRVKLVKSKSSALATMGTGDVLSGIIGAYAAKDDDIFVAGVAGAYLHATIGDKLHKEKGDHILASDVVDCIPAILKKTDK